MSRGNILTSKLVKDKIRYFEENINEFYEYLNIVDLQENYAQVLDVITNSLDVPIIQPIISLDDIDINFHDGTEIAIVNDNVFGHSAQENVNHCGSGPTLAWLFDICRSYVDRNRSHFNLTDLVKEIFLLSIGNDSTDLQAKFFELLGEGEFEMMVELVRNLDNIRSIHENEILQYDEIAGKYADAQFEGNHNMNDYTSNLDLLSSVGFSSEYLLQENRLGLRNRNVHSNNSNNTVSNPDNWRVGLAQEGTKEYHEKRGLPPGTTRKHGMGFEEVFIPAPVKPAALSSEKDEEFVKISALESWAQKAFKDTKKLNRIQSRVFNTAYNSAENMLICAPTGAGKTNIAMLTFLQLMKTKLFGNGQRFRTDGGVEAGDGDEEMEGREGGKVRRQDVKAVYIAPMKALAQEVK